MQSLTLFTLHDAVTDSPVYRCSSAHFDEQLELLEKWLESLSKHMKLYTDKLSKFNMETSTLCKKVIPVGIDSSMVPQFAGSVIHSFSDALQMSLEFKTQLVTDLEDNFIQPLQSFVKVQLKEFKDFKKQHEKCLERYESQLVKYTSLSKSKEPSAIREEAFRLYEARKVHVKMSSQHVMRVLHFRFLVEHFLVERFTLGTLYHLHDQKKSSEAWSKIESNLTCWKQWLVDDKETCYYQLQRLQYSRSGLETNYLAAKRPARDLEKYTVSQNNRHSLDLSGLNNMKSQKWGYLLIKTSRNSWSRRWFFLYEGCFGMTGRASKGTIRMSDRISILLCDVKPLVDMDRRFCFEVLCVHQPSFVLQAETEQEMREWITVFEKSKRLLLKNEQQPESIETPLASQTKKSSIVLLSSGFEQSNWLTPLLVREAASVEAKNPSMHLWGMPWTSMSEDTNEIVSPASSQEWDGNQVVWPLAIDDAILPQIDLVGYSVDLEVCNKELRHLFGGVSSEEIVLAAFTGVLKKTHVIDSEGPANILADSIDPEFDAQWSFTPKPPTSDLGYSYTGKGYITQYTFWFYSCLVLNCVNTVAVGLADIKTVRVINNYTFALDLVSTQKEPLIFACLMDNAIEIVGKLELAINQAKSNQPASLQSIHDAFYGNTISPVDMSPIPTDKKPRSITPPFQPKTDNLTVSMTAATATGKNAVVDAGNELSESPQDIRQTTVNIPVKDTATNPVSCGCENHLDKLESEVQLPVSAKTLFRLMFEDPDLWEKKTVGNKSKGSNLSSIHPNSSILDLTMNGWEKGSEGNMERTLKYIIPVNNSMVKLKEAEAIELQVLEKNIENVCYVVMTSTKTPQLPYADAFIPYLKYCITRVGNHQCQLACYTGVKFLKSILVKSIVTKAAMKGMAESLEVFIPIIQNELPQSSESKPAIPKPSELKRAKTAKRSTPEVISQPSWYKLYLEPVVDIVRDIINGLPLAIQVISALSIIFLVLYLKPGTKNPVEIKDQVISRAVYLKDIDQGFLHRNITSDYDYSPSFRLFLETNARNPTEKSIKHEWYSSRHRQMAIDLLFSRQRVALLRHDVLSFFQLMNQVDIQLLESEYTNWLMDTRLQCLLPRADHQALQCEDVKHQLISFPIRSIKQTQ